MGNEIGATAKKPEQSKVEQYLTQLKSQLARFRDDISGVLMPAQPAPPVDEQHQGEAPIVRELLECITIIEDMHQRHVL